MNNYFLQSFLIGLIVSCIASYVLIWHNTLRLHKRLIREVDEVEKEIDEQIKIIGRDELKKTRAGRALLHELQMRVNKAEAELLKLQFAFKDGLLYQSSNRIRVVAKYSLGKQRVKVKVVRIEDFGAFAELESGLEGLIHISKMAWGGVDDPSKVVNVGDVIEVSVEKIDLDKQQIYLSMLKAEEDPLSKYKVGERLMGTVKKIIPAGLIVELQPGVSGLVHISQVSSGLMSSEELNKQYRNGEEVKVLILKIDMENRRLSLSIKQA